MFNLPPRELFIQKIRIKRNLSSVEKCVFTRGSIILTIHLCNRERERERERVSIIIATRIQYWNEPTNRMSHYPCRGECIREVGGLGGGNFIKLLEASILR